MVDYEGSLLISRDKVKIMFNNHPNAHVLYVCTNDNVYTTAEEAQNRAATLTDKRVVKLDKDFELCKPL